MHKKLKVSKLFTKKAFKTFYKIHQQSPYSHCPSAFHPSLIFSILRRDFNDTSSRIKYTHFNLIRQQQTQETRLRIFSIFSFFLMITPKGDIKHLHTPTRSFSLKATRRENRWHIFLVCFSLDLKCKFSTICCLEACKIFQ